MLKGVALGEVAGRDWHVVRVPAQAELAVAELLAGRGHAVLVPTLTVYRRVNRYVHRKVEVAYPLLVRYVLVGFAGPVPWGEIGGLRERGLVQDVLMFAPERPARLQGRKVAEFLAAHENGDMTVDEAQRFMRTHREFASGDTVQVVEGVFEGRRVTVREIAGAVAKVLMSFFGAEVEASIPLALLEKLD